MTTLVWFFLAFAILGSTLEEEQECPAEEMLEDNLKKFGLANNYFALNLYRKLTTVTDGNIFISPFSISSVLAMLYKGARGGTAQELQKLLGFGRAKIEDSVVFSMTNHYLTEVLGKIDPSLYRINCASAMIVDLAYPLRPQYKQDIRELYQAYVQEVDIVKDSAEIVENMNTWVKMKSGGTIKSLADFIDPATGFLLVSAAYFKGSWRLEFEPSETRYRPFYNGGKAMDHSNVPTMHAYASYRFYEEEEFFSAVELAYEGKIMSMIIFLPKEMGGIDEMEQDLTTSKIAYVRRRMHYRKIHLALPKFKLGFNRDLSKELQELGLTQVFGFNADLSNMIAVGQMPVLSEVRHKAMVEVNEQGSVAAAISSVMMTKMMPSTKAEPKFIVNHPFIFAIVDTRSGLIMFMGRVNKL